jgi:diketogulonate reductase-like aldo/keto reductase
LNSLDYETVNQSIQTIIDELGSQRIDTLILSLPDKVFSQDLLPSEQVMSVWSCIQNYIDSKVIESAGLADFNAHYIKQFFNALEDQNVISKSFFHLNFILSIFIYLILNYLRENRPKTRLI